MPNSVACMNPMAPTVQCCVCSKPVKTCQTHKYDACPVPSHAQATKLRDNSWTCSQECYETATQRVPEEKGYGYGV